MLELFSILLHLRFQTVDGKILHNPLHFNYCHLL